jgi:hypothetical protein
MPKPGNDDREENREQRQKYVDQYEPIRFALEGEIPETLSHAAFVWRSPTLTSIGPDHRQRRNISLPAQHAAGSPSGRLSRVEKISIVLE